MRDADHAALEARLDQIEQNSLVHMSERLARVEKYMYLLIGLVTGSGLLNVAKWVL